MAWCKKIKDRPEGCIPTKIEFGKEFIMVPIPVKFFIGNNEKYMDSEGSRLFRTLYKEVQERYEVTPIEVEVN